MRRLDAWMAAILLVLPVIAENAAKSSWNEWQKKRDSLAGARQEFDVSRTFKVRGGAKAIKQQLIIDMAAGRWRETSISGSGNYLTIFDGDDVLRMEEGGDEFMRVKSRSSKGEKPAPDPYDDAEIDWSKASEGGRQPCGLPGRGIFAPLFRRPSNPISAITLPGSRAASQNLPFM